MNGKKKKRKEEIKRKEEKREGRKRELEKEGQRQDGGRKLETGLKVGGREEGRKRRRK